MHQQATDHPAVTWTGGQEHWVDKGDVRLFLWEKKRKPGTAHAGTVLFVHGSSMASQPTFDLHVPGRPDSSVMEWFSERRQRERPVIRARLGSKHSMAALVVSQSTPVASENILRMLSHSVSEQDAKNERFSSKRTITS